MKKYNIKKLKHTHTHTHKRTQARALKVIKNAWQRLELALISFTLYNDK